VVAGQLQLWRRMELMVVPLLLCWLTTASDAPALTGYDILTRVADGATLRHAAMPEYRGVRRYTVRNFRFRLQADATVTMSYSAASGKHFTVAARSGSEKLNGIIDRLLESEAEASRPSVSARSALSPANYHVGMAGVDEIGGRPCFVLALRPKTKSRYLIRGKAWVDLASFAVVRIEGTPAASVSWWLGEPRIIQEFAETAGFWLPVLMRSESSSFMLGSSQLEISYGEYELAGAGERAELGTGLAAWSAAASNIPQSRPEY
jgi:hypothetical protein